MDRRIPLRCTSDTAYIRGEPPDGVSFQELRSYRIQGQVILAIGQPDRRRSWFGTVGGTLSTMTFTARGRKYDNVRTPRYGESANPRPRSNLEVCNGSRTNREWSITLRGSIEVQGCPRTEYDPPIEPSLGLGIGKLLIAIS